MNTYPFTEGEARQRQTDEAIASFERHEMREGLAIRPHRPSSTGPLQVVGQTTIGTDTYYSFAPLDAEEGCKGGE